MQPWYQESFGAEYLALYAHRDDAEAQRDIRAAVALAGLGPGARILDLACGAGRHLRALCAEGFDGLVGLDLSPDLLTAACDDLDERARCCVDLVRADMRQIPFGGVFDAVFSLFTSFGYFEREEEDLAVLEGAHHALKPGGVLLMDVMNRPWVLANLVACDTCQRGDREITNQRCLTPDGKRVTKECLVRYPDGSLRRFFESVRLYTPEEMLALLCGAGFDDVRRYGSLAGDAYTPESPRLVLRAERGGAA